MSVKKSELLSNNDLITIEALYLKNMGLTVYKKGIYKVNGKRFYLYKHDTITIRENGVFEINGKPAKEANRYYCYGRYKQITHEVPCISCHEVTECLNATRHHIMSNTIQPPNSLFCNCCMKYSEELKYIGVQKGKKTLYLYNCVCDSTLSSEIKLNLG